MVATILGLRTYSMCGMRTFSLFYRGTCVFKLAVRTMPVRRTSAVAAKPQAYAAHIARIQARLDAAFPMPATYTAKVSA